jgi:hypothetical protein
MISPLKTSVTELVAEGDQSQKLCTSSIRYKKLIISKVMKIIMMVLLQKHLERNQILILLGTMQ